MCQITEGSVSASTQPLQAAGSLSHLGVIPAPMATYQRMAISSDDLRAAQQLEFPANTEIREKGLGNYNRSRSESNLADEDRCVLPQ